MNLSFCEVVPFGKHFIWWDGSFVGSMKREQTTGPRPNETTSLNKTNLEVFAMFNLVEMLQSVRLFAFTW